jgi:hypothetical protein
MATPTNLPADFVPGAVLTAAQMDDLRGAFRILQVVSAGTTTTVSTATTTYADTGVTATITPQSTSSLILVLIAQNLMSTAAVTGAGIRLMRDATVLETWNDNALGFNSGIIVSPSFIHLDSPATTSARTYKTQVNRTVGSGTIFAQPNNAGSKIILFEVSA